MADTPDVLAFVLGATSFSDLLDNVELLTHIGRQDERIATRVERQATNEDGASRRDARDAARGEVARRERGRRTRCRAAAIRDRLAARATRSPRLERDKRDTLAAIRGGPRATFAAEVDGARSARAQRSPRRSAAPPPRRLVGSGRRRRPG